MGSESDKSAGLQAGCLLAVIFLCIAVVGAGAIIGIIENKKNKELPGAEELAANLSEYAAIAKRSSTAASDAESTTPIGKVVPVDVTDDPPKLDFDIWKALPAANHPTSDKAVESIAVISYFKKEFPEYYDAGETGYAYACNVKLVSREGVVIREGEVAGSPPSIIAEGSKNVGALNDMDVVAFILGSDDEADETGQ